MLLALAGTARAEMSVSQSNDPTAAIGVDLTTLLDNEKASLDTLERSRLQAIMATQSLTGAAEGDAEIGYSTKWLAGQPAAKGGAEFQCLATALYFEARGEGVKGQAAVAEVILNRVDSPSFPKTICGVVEQSNGRGCQFSYVCDGRSDRIRDKQAFVGAGKIARAMMDGADRALTDGATYFHTPAVRPSWSKRFERTARIGRHIFYKAPVKTASLD